jgi:anti-sigma factor RsiW
MRVSAKVVPFDGDGHHAVQTLLPWYVSGRLDRAEMAEIDAHLADCPQCRAELAWECKMSAAQATVGGVAGDADRGLAQLHSRIRASEELAPPMISRRPKPASGDWPGLAPWLRWLVGTQFAAILLLIGLQVVPLKPVEPFHALGAAGQAGTGNVVVRFRPDATERDIRSALQDADARLVGGPTATDAYLLSVPAEHLVGALAGLRANRSVVLAESLDSGARP